jgi:hypothetical protein
MEPTIESLYNQIDFSDPDREYQLGKLRVVLTPPVSKLLVREGILPSIFIQAFVQSTYIWVKKYKVFRIVLNQ